MRFMPIIKDTRGRESHTLLIVSAAIIILLPKFALSSLTIWGVQFPPMTGGEFAAAFGAIMMIWLGREWTEKTGGK